MAGRDESVQVAEEEEGLVFSVSIRPVRRLSQSSQDKLDPQDIPKHSQDDPVYSQNDLTNPQKDTDGQVQIQDDLTNSQKDTDGQVQIQDDLPSKRAEPIRTVKAGTVYRLIEYLAPLKTKVDVSYRTCFLATYRTFTTPKKVLTVMEERFATMTPVPSDTDTVADEKTAVQNSICTFLHIWLETYPEDFYATPLHADLCTLEVLVQQCIGKGEGLVEQLERVRKETARRIISLKVEIFLNVQRTNSFSLFSLSAMHFVQALTAEDNHIFQMVLPQECLFYIRSSSSGHCPTVRAAITHFNRVTLIAIATILRGGESAEERGKVIGRWIDIAQQCRLVKNFSSLKAILSSLQSLAIYRLRKSWDTVPREKIAQLEELSHLFTSDDNFFLSRDLLSREGTSKHVELQAPHKKKTHLVKATGMIPYLGMLLTDLTTNPVAHSDRRMVASGVIPYLGTFLTDLTMIHEAHPDTLPNGLVNFEKRRKEFELLAQLTLYQKSAMDYSFSHQPQLVQWLRHSPVWPEKESYEESKMLEPDTLLDPGHVAQKPLWKTVGQLFKTAVPSSYSRIISGSHSEKSLYPTLYQHTSTISPQPPLKPGSQIVRIGLTGPSQCMFRTMEVREGDRASWLVREAMKKYGISGDPSQYQLVMECETRQRTVPDDAILFYALPDSTPTLILTPKNASFNLPPLE